MEMAYFKNNFWGEKNAGFDVLYHNMKHGQIATKELAEFVRERAAIEETYSKSMSKLAKMASNGSPLGTFAPMWDVFRVSSDKVALCHQELMRKMNDLIRDINKYSEEQVKIHRKTKEEVIGTLEAVQSLQVQNAHLQKSREGYHSKCVELERLRKEGAPQKELEKAELKSKKVAESFAASIEKFNRAGGDFEQKMSESAQKFQDIEEAHLRQMKLLIKGYSHSIEDTHVQVGQVYEEFKQNVENIGTENLIQKFTEQKGTGKDRPGQVGFEEYLSSLVPENSKKSRAKAFRIPGLGKRDKEPDSTDSAVADALNSPLEVDDEGFVIRADVKQNGCAAEDKEANFYSSDSDFDDEEPKKFHIQIRPFTSSSRSNSAANELELKATVGALTLATNRTVSVKKQLSRNSSSAGRSEGEGESVPQRDGEHEGLRISTSSPDHSRLSSTASGSDALFGPPLESAFKSHSFNGRVQLQNAFAASEYAAFSSDSSSPENVEDSGLDSPSRQPLGMSPEPTGWAAWPPTRSQSKDSVSKGRSTDPFLAVYRDPSPGRSPLPQDDPTKAWPSNLHSPRAPPDIEPTTFSFPAFSHSLASSELEPSVWSCKHIPPEDPFFAAFEQLASKGNLPPPDAWALPPPRPTRDSRGVEGRIDPFYISLNDTKTLPPPSSLRKDRERKRDCSVPPPESPDDPFAITMIGSPTHQSSLAVQAAAQSRGSGNRPTPSPNPAPSSQPKKELVNWNSVHNPFSEGVQNNSTITQESTRKQKSFNIEHHRNGPPLTRHSGPQEDLCFSTDKDQNCLESNTQPVHQHSFRQDSTERLALAPPRSVRSKRSSGRLSGCERSRSLCSSPLPDPSPPLTSSSSSSPSDWGVQNRVPSPARGLSRGPSPISLSTQESWPVAAAITEYINAYFKGGEHNRCLVKITGDLTMSFPAGITRLFTVNPNTPVLSFRLVNISRVDHILPNQKLLYSDPSQSDPGSKDFWFNMQALTLHLQREAELNPQASYYNVALLKYQASSQDPGRAPLLLSAECQRSGTVTRVSLDYHCCPATAPATQLTSVQVLLPLDHTATDLQCQPTASWNTEERRLLWKLPNLSPTNHSKGSGTLCASWQCLEVPRGPPPSLAVQFVGLGASLSGMDVELVGSRYRMSLVKKRFATGKYMAGCSL
ncbi:F-BAR domain only protein 1-like isoform X1 [Myxocyprinus asiaticus]|uniref:F-BAR domain only protein 1-like isoform X1 n=1 Tax=Myxocyprinus asiaticus TaxID=70543 RepID=UPI002223D22D|nr:F-BAR domain only protein 1-like isoform X1 [Myxocyprinus asiaticus]XP_051525753.1 F-BAR domain only protein 1-like isoform X1 [Myxocyprinus asiaticus]XP_051525754.1 F-BAR domain only protein 1-like isoform X1 [Myxocyprinus asiaticus]